MRDRVTVTRGLTLGLVVLCAGLLAAGGIWALGRNEFRFNETFTVRAEFQNVGGIQPGTRVQIQGMDAGVVDSIEPPTQPGEGVIVNFRLDKNLQHLVRADAVATLQMEGVVGSKIVQLAPGSRDAEIVSDGDTIAGTEPVRWEAMFDELRTAADDFRSKADDATGLVQRLDRIAAKIEAGEGTIGKLLTDESLYESAEDTIAQANVAIQDLSKSLEKVQKTGDKLDAIAESVQSGEGTLGKLVTSSEAHDQAVESLAAAEQMMTTMNDTMLAARQTWLLRSTFQEQGMSDPRQILYRPDHRNTRKSLAASQLFETGTAILSREGKQQLTKVAAWLKENPKDDSEIVVATFSSGDDHTQAQRLTQLRSEAVRDYLVDVHDVHHLGYFSRRNVLAAGFGSQDYNGGEKLPRDRVDVYLFVPEA